MSGRNSPDVGSKRVSKVNVAIETSAPHRSGPPIKKSAVLTKLGAMLDQRRVQPGSSQYP